MPVLVQKSDATIQQDVMSELRWDTRVSETEVGVEVDAGVVTLTGTVDSYLKKLAAEEAAHRVVGVQDVANDLVVCVPGHHLRTDTEIAQAVRRTLEWDSVVPEDRIQSTVSQGWVTLSGMVDTNAEREDAENSVKRLLGVRGVTNKIGLISRPIRPEELKKAVEDALERRALREASRISVLVRDNTVVLAGRVPTWAERRAVVGAVSHAPGVRAVEDRIVVDPLG